jgi:hypothetical protein
MIGNATIKDFLVLPLKEIDMEALIAETMQEKDDSIMDLNKQQLDRGLDAKGNSLGRYKNFKYKNRFQPVDLKLKGDFRNKFTMAAGKKSAEIFSQDFKDGFLVKHYGKDIQGIADQSKSNVAELIHDPMGEKYKKKLLKK